MEPGKVKGSRWKYDESCDVINDDLSDEKYSFYYCYFNVDVTVLVLFSH